MKLKLIKGTDIEDGMCDCCGCFYLNVDAEKPVDIILVLGGKYDLNVFKHSKYKHRPFAVYIDGKVRIQETGPAILIVNQD